MIYKVREKYNYTERITNRRLKMEKERFLMVKVKEKTHSKLMELKYKLNLKPKSASNTIKFLINFYKKNKKLR